MNISLENWLRNKLQETEEMHEYAVATETLRIWIDQYNHLKKEAFDADISNHFKNKFGLYANEIYEYLLENIERKEDLKFKLEKKCFWSMFLAQYKLTPRKISMKHFTSCVLTFCEQKNISMKQKRDNNRNPLTGIRGLEYLYFEKQKNIES
jgi:hypothetical protein